MPVGIFLVLLVKLIVSVLWVLVVIVPAPVVGCRPPRMATRGYPTPYSTPVAPRHAQTAVLVISRPVH